MPALETFIDGQFKSGMKAELKEERMFISGEIFRKLFGANPAGSGLSAYRVTRWEAIRNNKKKSITLVPCDGCGEVVPGANRLKIIIEK